MFEFAKLLLFVSFGYSMIAFYESPLPGIGVSFSNLITDQAFYFQSVLEARAFDNIYQHFDDCPTASFSPMRGDPGQSHLLDRPAPHRVCEGGVDGRDRLRPDRQRRVRAARTALRPVLHRAQARLAVLGWFKAFIQYSFIPVVAIAFLMVFERFIFRYVTTLPPTITQAEYGVYALQAVAVVITFCTRYPAGAVADDVDLLRPWRSGARSLA